MPLYAPVLSESKKFLDPMQEARIIQRSEWLFEMEIPMRHDMLPGMVFVKEYGGRYTIKVELLYKRFPDGYLFTDEFKSMAADQHVYINKHDHERWLKHFMNPKEQRAPTPTKTPPYSSDQIISDTPAQGPFCKHQVEGPLRTSKFPQVLDPNIVDQHPMDARVSYDYGESRPVRERIGLPPEGPSPFPSEQAPSSSMSTNITTNVVSNVPMPEPLPSSSTSSAQVVGGSGEQADIDTYTLDQILTWTFKRLGNRRSTLIKSQKKAQKAGRLHQYAIITDQLQLISKAQRINKFGTFGTKEKSTVDMDVDDQEETSSVVAELRSRRGIAPPLKRPGTIYPTRKELAAKRAEARTVRKSVPPRPPRRNLLIPPLLPIKRCINFSSDNNMIDTCQSIDNCSFFDEEPRIFKRLSARNHKVQLKSKPKRHANNNDNKSCVISRKSQPVHRSRPPMEILSPIFNQGGFDVSGELDDSTIFLEGSPNDPKVYLGGRFSDQSEPDSPTTAARINARALWYEPCTRLEYRYKQRAWRAEGLPGRPTNSPLKFSLPY